MTTLLIEIIEDLFETEYVVMSGEKYITLSGTQPQYTNRISFASVFKSRDRAEKIAKKVNGKVEVFYGAPIKGTKDSVAGKTNPVNKSSPYRSC